MVSAIQFSHHDKGIYPSRSHVVKMNVHIACIKRSSSGFFNEITDKQEDPC